MPLTRPSKNGALSSGSCGAVSWGAWEKDYPDLVEFLSRSTWEDGKPRATGTITLFLENGFLRIWINDKDGGRGTCITAPSPEEGLLLSSLAVSSAETAWRADVKARQGRK